MPFLSSREPSEPRESSGPKLLPEPVGAKPLVPLLSNALPSLCLSIAQAMLKHCPSIQKRMLTQCPSNPPTDRQTDKTDKTDKTLLHQKERLTMNV